VSFARLMLPGDWLSLVAAAVLVAALVPVALRGGKAERVVVKVRGQVVAELPLTAPRSLEVDGALGLTRIEVQPGRARVASDPGPRQYCVRQGWLTRPNSIAICAPNQVSLMLIGKQAGYDSLNY
jgi:hypothetical protein